MSVITCLKELEKIICLKDKDIVEFTINSKVIKYQVLSFHLQNLKDQLDPSYNDEIFKILELNKFKIAEKAYGYKAVNLYRDSKFPNTYWPEIEYKDFPALTKLVKELYIIIEERKPKYTKYNRFEIMDI